MAINLKVLDLQQGGAESELEEKRRALEAAYQAYAKLLEKAAAVRTGISFDTISGAPNKVLYTPLDIEDLDYQRDLGIVVGNRGRGL